MSLPSDHKALLFFASVAVLGAGVRVVRASARASTGSSQPSLDRQVQAADSAAHAGRGRAARAAGSKPNRAAPSDTDTLKKRSTPRARSQLRGSGALDRPGWIAGKLDLDVATAAQLDSLPGVTPLMAKRIVADRMAHGPFLDRDGLRRVSGIGPKFLAAIDSLITFSGTYAWPSPGDSVIAPRRKARGRKSARPPP